MNDITSHMDVSCHIPPLAPAEPALHLQSFEASLPPGDNELDGQEVHMLEDVAPEPAKNVPTEQSRQANDAELPWYLPGEHSTHVPPPPLAPAEPALHLQSFEASLPGGDNELDGQEVQKLEDDAPEPAQNVPAEQSRQADDAELPWYLPGEHDTHVTPPPLAPAEPALHLQSFEASLPAGDNELDGQEVHILDETAPDVGEYFPPKHDVQVPTVAPTAAEYVPAMQLVHAPAHFAQEPD